ncbi:hypothetical protein JAAARDRAFT_143459, partial [Jaapia argillacea MUCL 33604]
LHWLCAKAMWDRWEEEIMLVMHKMKWVCNYFMHRRGTWLSRSNDISQSPTPGHK